MKYLKTLNAIHAKLGRLGDLPVFSATVNRIQQISSSKESDAMALAMAVMKDANLSARLLRLANSTYYNRSGSRINVISRAVIMIGFDEIKNLSVTLKLIESFHKANPDTDVASLLMRSFLTAAISREMAMQAGLDDIEETYTCGLLHGLGEIVYACTLSEDYRQLQQLQKSTDQPWKRIQLEHIGAHFSDIGQELAQSWGFPPSVVASMDAMTAEEPKGAVRRNFEITSSVDRLLQLLYGQGQPQPNSFSSVIEKMAQITGANEDTLKQSLSRGFKMVSDMASEYGLSQQSLNPPLRQSGDDELDEFARKASYYIHTQQQINQAEDINPPPQPVEETPNAGALAQTQLDYLQEIGELVNQQTPIPTLLNKVIAGIVASTSLDRAGFVMLSPDRQQLRLRLSDGDCIDDLQRYFALKAGQGDDFFFKVLKKQMTLLVTDTQESGWPERLPEAFRAKANPRGFIMAPLCAGKRVLGFLYADQLSDKPPLEQETFRGFNQFYMQAKMALAYSSQQSG
ncbi:HDOD domain-containing protein [Motiliproteus coralliicola]|uniref:HDOD domain-containing protein n=1 Tax=Motiliproteus coralliicola TaxID=2283196 RepID=A0A369WK12_9GAMM|nr:HDOD domain-containing protein [Motiliproteus coralliicola]RDE22380.1 HDOD domain-containing protein [Motiliproteus coralliicola]